MLLTTRQIDALAGCDKRINILSGSVRSGKTYALYWKFNQYAQFGPSGKLAIVAKTLETLRENILDPMRELIGPDFKYSDNGRRISLAGRKIRGVGANDEKSKSKIQGDTLAGVMGDEITLWPESFFKMLLSRLSVSGAKAFFSCNPDSPFHYLKKDFIDHRGTLSLSYHEFNIDDNTSLDPEYIRNLKNEYHGLWYQRYIDGKWVAADAAIYDMFSIPMHVMGMAKKFSNRFYAADYGTSNPFACLEFQFDNASHVHVAREYYYDSSKERKQKTDSEYADDIMAFMVGDQPVIYVDPAAASFKLELMRRGVIVLDADNDVVDGIRFVSRMMGQNKLTIDPGCQNLIEEIPNYIWDEKAQRRGEDKPVKSNDHACDALRYGLYSKFKFGNPESVEKW